MDTSWIFYLAIPSAIWFAYRLAMYMYTQHNLNNNPLKRTGEIMSIAKTCKGSYFEIVNDHEKSSRRHCGIPMSKIKLYYHDPYSSKTRQKLAGHFYVCNRQSCQYADTKMIHL